MTLDNFGGPAAWEQYCADVDWSDPLCDDCGGHKDPAKGWSDFEDGICMCEMSTQEKLDYVAEKYNIYPVSVEAWLLGVG